MKTKQVLTTKDTDGFKITMTIPESEWAKFKPEQKAAMYEATGALIVAGCRTKKRLREVNAIINDYMTKAEKANPDTFGL